MLQFSCNGREAKCPQHIKDHEKLYFNPISTLNIQWPKEKGQLIITNILSEVNLLYLLSLH